ncbi:hypothetical protein D038_2449B, partial [Vibrio parahaemolyticus IDH02189]
WSPKIDNNWR